MLSKTGRVKPTGSPGRTARHSSCECKTVDNPSTKEENVHDQNIMLFLKMERREGAEAGTQREMWEQIQCLCMSVEIRPSSSVIPQWLNSPISVIANYGRILIWGGSAYWPPLSPWTSVSEVGQEPQPRGNGWVQIHGASQWPGREAGVGWPPAALTEPHGPDCPATRCVTKGPLPLSRKRVWARLVFVVGICYSNTVFIVFAVRESCPKEHSVVHKISSWIISILS